MGIVEMCIRKKRRACGLEPFLLVCRYAALIYCIKLYIFKQLNKTALALTTSFVLFYISCFTFILHSQ